MKRSNFISLLVVVMGLGLLGLSCVKQEPNPALSKNDAPVAVVTKTQPQVEEPVTKPLPPIPVAKPVEHVLRVLAVPFTSQAPDSNWDMPYQEACEEASMIMVAEYLAGNHTMRLSIDYADKKILELVAWEEANGYAIDVTAKQVVAILRERYRIAAQVEPYSADRLRQAIQAKQPVILPAAGKLLMNPNFKNGGPLYHMLVVKGFEANEFITNDPGTRKGENYRYDESAFSRAVHDWNNGDVTHGEQLMIVVGGLLN